MRPAPTLAACALAALLAPPARAAAQVAVDPVVVEARIRAEGLGRDSEALELYRTLTDRFGARLAASPAYEDAAAWARDRFASWGLEARLEPFEFGRGWSLEKISVEMTAPRYMPLTAYPEAWTPSVEGGVVSGRVVYVGDSTAEEIARMGDELRGAIVLTHEPQDDFLDEDRPQPGLSDEPVRTGNPRGVPLRSDTPMREMRELLQRAGAAVTLRPSPYRDGTVGVTGSRTTADDAVPAIVVATEQYNLLARLVESGVPVELRVELRTRYHEEDELTHNVIAEIPGTDPGLRDEIVLIGAHLDSWHTAIGATDNADGATAVMEAMRILSVVEPRPRRTIRAALWSGEEQGLLGARAYVSAYLDDPVEHERLSVYLNDDPGSGRTLGFYMQGNEAAKRVFDAWLEPLRDLGATRNVIEPIGSTDHVPFHDAGVPAFTAIKDFEAYDTRTRHTNADYPERMSERELTQQAIVLAHLAWHAAMADERVPRDPTPEP
ncbi:MAG TPA: M28 family peptidase [Longimicrobiales bacterium]|nr:M28 family peptidase [Longimicrobiales bacterium]